MLHRYPDNRPAGWPNATILVVDADRELNERLCRYLHRHGFSAIPVYRGGDVARYLSEVDLIVLDIVLPDLEGLTLLRRIRLQQAWQISILVLSELAGGEDRILGLNLGADDYLGKPALCAEILARVKALLRRKAWITQGFENPGKPRLPRAE